MISVLIEAISSVIVAILKLFTSCHGKPARKKSQKKSDDFPKNQVTPHHKDGQGGSQPHHRHRRASITETCSTTTTREFVVEYASPSISSTTPSPAASPTKAISDE